MYRQDIRCPLEYGLDVFGGKWNSRIICVLTAKKTLRYSELRKNSVMLRTLCLPRLLKRFRKHILSVDISYDEIPPRVEYSLTKRGLSVVPMLQSICIWAGAYYKNENDT